MSAAGTLMAALAAVGALYFSNSTVSASNEQLGLARQTAQSELFKSAAEQLDSDKESVRLSGVYLLERLALDSVADQPTVRRLLEAFVRTETSSRTCEPPEREAPVDIQAALDVIGKYGDLPAPTPVANLFAACLVATSLEEANLPDAWLEEADLTWASLYLANLTQADLEEANLTEAHLKEANLTEAVLVNTNLARAFLTSAVLTKAILENANLADASLYLADLTGADLRGADLTSVDLRGANLTDAYLVGTDLLGANLTEANLTGVFYDGSTRWPAGFAPPPSA